MADSDPKPHGDRPETRRRRVGEWLVDPGTGQIRRASEIVSLQPRTMQVLLYLADHADEVVSIRELLDTVWGDTVISEESVYQHIARLRQSLGDSSDRPSYIRTVPRRGYRLIANVTDDEPSEPATVPEFSWLRQRIAVIALLVGVAATFGLIFYLRMGADLGESSVVERGLPQLPSRSLAVMPFSSPSGDPESARSANAVSEEIIHQIADYRRQTTVTPLASSFRYWDSSVSARSIGRDLGVSYILTGTLHDDDGTLRLATRLIRTADEHLVDSRDFERALDDEDLLESIKQLGRSVAHFVDKRIKRDIIETIVLGRWPQWEGAVEFYYGAMSGDPRVWDQSGILELQEELESGTARSVKPSWSALNIRRRQVDLRSAPVAGSAFLADFVVDNLRRSIEVEPTFVPGYVSLALEYVVRDDMSPQERIAKARNAGEKALGIMPGLLGGLYWHARTSLLDLDYAAARRDIERCIALHPSHGECQDARARLSFRLGNISEATAAWEVSRELEPLSNPAALLEQGNTLRAAGDLGRALAVIEQGMAEAFDPCAVRSNVSGSSFPHAELLARKAELLLMLGRHAEAERVIDDGLEIEPAFAVSGIYAIAKAGRVDEARMLTDALLQASRDQYVDPVFLVQAFLGLGDLEDAYVWLNRGIEEKSRVTVFMRAPTFFSEIREGNRFEDSITRLERMEMLRAPSNP